ncbi:MAG: hypothetical protein WD381_04395 [Balneolaceae bacterium]
MKFHKLFLILSVAIVTGVIFSCSKITGEQTTTEQPISYQITEGACGEVTFEENIGPDSLSAVETIRKRKVEFFGHSNFMIESTQLKVEDENGIVPEEEFFALHILDEDSLHLHSVSEVITNEGDLYNLSWCPD